jgi:tellurite resistance protein TerA
MPIDYTKPAPAAPSTPQPPSAPAPAAAGVTPSKVTLTKAAPAVSLSKTGAAVAGVMRVNLNWNARPAGGGGGMFKRAAPGIDLDLGCLYELSNGRKGVVQALGNALRSANEGAPLISLDGDDRSGTNSGGENLSIDLSRLAEIRRVLVFAFIYEGTPNWAEANGVVTLFPPAGGSIEVQLDESDPKARMCAIAMLDNTGHELSIRREVRYLQGGQQVLDQAYGWGMQWAPGRK